MPLPNFSDSIGKNIIRQIKYRGTIRTGEVIADNGDGTYDVKIALSDETYPNVETIHYDMVFNVGEIAVIGFEYGSKELPKIIGHSKKVAQDPVNVEVDYSGIVRVETLNAYSVTSTTAYLEGRIALGGAGNCKTRGFEYGTTTAYEIGSPHDDGSYGNGSYNKQITGLTKDTTYHFRAYIIDENNDTIYGDDKTFITSLENNLISCDANSDLIYKHSGVTSTIIDSFAAPSSLPCGLTYVAGNLISCDYGQNKIYIHTGITSTITDSFASPADYPYGLAYIENNLISCDLDIDTIYKHSGVTSTITDSFASPSSPASGLTCDGNNLISCSYRTIYKHSGVTSTITDSFASPADSCCGLTYIENNLISSDSTTDLIYKHSGVTSTITDSFASPNGAPYGLTYT